LDERIDVLVGRLGSIRLALDQLELWEKLTAGNVWHLEQFSLLLEETAEN
jgi:hypothetical protein